MEKEAKIPTANPLHDYLSGDETKAYRMGLQSALAHLAPYWTATQRRAIETDLQLSAHGFDEPKYLQAACETVITSTLGRMFPNTFVYEHKIKPPKDVDCSFEKDGFRFNFEIKCPDYSKQHAIDATPAFKIGAFGRMDDYSALVENLQSGAFNTQENPSDASNKPLIMQQHMDNKLKDFLLSAHSKFADDCSEQELNVLVVCCSDRMSMQEWYHYMYGSKGLLTRESYYPPDQYNNVDLIILTNVYHRHHDYKKKDKVSDHWDWEKAFNLIFSNLMRKKDKKDAILKLVDLVPNHSQDLKKFKVTQGLDEMRIAHFIAEELLAKGKYYFQPDT